MLTVNFLALDPVAPSMRKKSAMYTQCIFTQFGSLSPDVGECYASFYVNGGSIQPQCQNSKNTLCSHFYSFEYFIYSLNPKNKFYGYTCRIILSNNFSVFNDKDLMGIYAER